MLGINHGLKTLSIKMTEGLFESLQFLVFVMMSASTSQEGKRIQREEITN
jgi:hypothetical protein